MDIGKVGVLVGLAASLVTVVLYLLALRGDRRTLRAARVAYAISALTVVFCFGRLMQLVVHHRFDYEYVFDYVSADLHGSFLYAATWAGQQGSFLLWALCTALIGGLVAWKAGKWEARVMPFYVTALVCLFAILAWLSPYNPLPRGGETGWPWEAPWPPANGRGLNPSLQNYWMAIHPPTIFFGFASLAVPFCYAVAAMLWREYSSWAGRVMPWVLLTVATLGVGLFMGGYWAYETQGWHGFWAWDPVENASLFPWLGAVALAHGLIVQKSRGGMARTNLFLAIVPWLLFLYGTFLTRSGVLASFSVHAFGMLDNPALKVLIGMVVVYGAGGIGLLVWRWRSVPARPISDKLLSRDTAMVLAVTLMIAAAVAVTLGTSWPLVSRWPVLQSLGLKSLYAAKGMRAEPLFYNKIGSALLIPALLIMGMVPFLAWGKTNGEKFLSKLLAPWLTAVALGFLTVWFVQRQRSLGFRPDTPPALVVTIATLGAFAAIANIVLAVRLFRVRAVTMGGWLAHVGIGMMFAGTVITNVYEQSRDYELIQGRPPLRTPYGYALQFAGWTHDAKLQQAADAADPAVAARLRQEVEEHDWRQFGHGVKLRVIPIQSEAGAVHADSPDMQAADPHAGMMAQGAHAGLGLDGPLDEKHAFTAVAPVFHNQQLLMNDDPDAPKTMRWPVIHKELGRDFYVIVASDPQQLFPRVTLRPGETSAVAIPGLMESNYTVSYKRFYRQGDPGQPGTVMGAEMVLTTPDGRRIPIRPGRKLGGEDGMESVNVSIPGAPGLVELDGVNAANKEVTANFVLPGVRPQWVIPITVTHKPGINLVWLGAVLMGLGALVAMARRAFEARRGVLMQTAAAAGAGDVVLAAVTEIPTNGHEPARSNGGNGHGSGSGGKPQPGRSRPKTGARR